MRRLSASAPRVWPTSTVYTAELPTIARSRSARYVRTANVSVTHRASDGDDLRRRPLVERKAALAKLLIRSRGGIQYVEHAEGHGDKMFAGVCDLGLEGIVSKKLTAPYRSGPTRNWIKVKNPNAPAATRVLEGGF
jgi:hypothetical protein